MIPILVLYRNNDSDSLLLANSYKLIYGLNDNQLLGLDCSSDEILLSYDDFKTQIEDQVLNYLDNFNSEYNTNINYILIGFNVPGGFYDGDDIISSSSRLSTIYYPYEKKIINPLYGKKNSITSLSLDYLIVSRIDAPTINIALNQLYNGQYIYANGYFFFDKYSIIRNDNDIEYQNDLTSFEDILLNNLHLPLLKTLFWDEYSDVYIPKLINDSFVWSFNSLLDNNNELTTFVGYSYFKENQSSRIFSYISDNDGLKTIRNSDETRFPMVSISSGYKVTAGAMSNPGSDGYLRPYPFFLSLKNNLTIGEAYIYSLPYLNWTISLIGDPLLKVKFPASSIDSNKYSKDMAFDLIINDFLNAAAYRYNSNDQLKNILQIVSQYSVENIDLYNLFSNLYFDSDKTWMSSFTDTSNQIVKYIINNQTSQTSAFSNYLKSRNKKISELFTKISNSSLESSLIMPNGEWTIESNIATYGSPSYHFEVDISFDNNFLDIIYSIDSELDQSGWEYEKYTNDFSPVPQNGVSYIYDSKRIRYTCDESKYLPRGTIFYYRIREKDNFSFYGSYREYMGVVKT